MLPIQSPTTRYRFALLSLLTALTLVAFYAGREQQRALQANATIRAMRAAEAEHEGMDRLDRQYIHDLEGKLEEYEAKAAHEQRERNQCRLAQRILFSAEQQWALDHRSAPFSAPPLLKDLSGHYGLRDGHLPTCPTGGTILLGKTVDDNPVCTIHGDLLATNP